MDMTKLLFKMSKKLAKSAVKDFKADVKKSFKKSTKSKPVVCNNYHEEIDFYDHDVDKAESLYEKYEDYCYDIYSEFYDMFDLKQRIKMLEKAIEKFNTWKSFCHSKGTDGITYFEEEYAYITKSPFSPVERDMNGDYIYEFESADFCNIEFLTNLLKEYKDNPENSKAHLKDEHIYYCGGMEEYEHVQKLQALPKNILKIIKQNDSLRQKDLYPLLPDFSKNEIQKAVNKLVSSGKITKTAKTCYLELK